LVWFLRLTRLMCLKLGWFVLAFFVSF